MPTDDSGPLLSPETLRWSFLRSFTFWRNLVVTFLVMLPLLIRFWFLSKVPPAPIPFDVEEFCRIEIESGQNAFDYFREAVRLKSAVEADHRARNIVFDWSDYNAVMANGWSVATDSLKQWMIDHGEAIQVWRRGTECSDALYISPGEMKFSDSLPVAQDVRAFARMALIDAARLESEGRLFEAAELYLAILRSGDLVRRHGGIIQNLIGVGTNSTAIEPLVKWAEDSRVTAEELRSVLKQVRAVNQHVEPPSTAWKIEYMTAIRSLSQTGWCKETGLTEKYGKFEPYASTGMEAFLCILGEPEVARRAVTHVLTNLLGEVDKPLAERGPMAETSTVGLFTPRGQVSSPSLSAAAIERAVQRSIVAKHVIVPFTQYDRTINRDRARRVGLELVLAAQIYFRDHGEFPAETSALIPDYIDSWPVDPLQSTADGLMQYERESTTSARIRSLDGWGFDATLESRTPALKKPSVP